MRPPRCACGCGQPVTRVTKTNTAKGVVKGQWHRFVAHHNLLVGVVSVTHGRLRTYRDGCRCDPCEAVYRDHRAGQTLKQRDRREAKRGQLEKRACTFRGCPTILSMHNPGPCCFVHAPLCLSVADHLPWPGQTRSMS